MVQEQAVCRWRFVADLMLAVCTLLAISRSLHAQLVYWHTASFTGVLTIVAPPVSL